MTLDATPIRRQYLEIKRQHPNEILFFRLGDFYETFDADAEVAARELNITLTSRPVGKNTRVPLAGIPYHAADSYIAVLLRKGYHVAICEQMGEAPTNGLVPRKVVRIVTPGTILEPQLLLAAAGNYLAALACPPQEHLPQLIALAYTDVTTGSFFVCQLPPKMLPAELDRIKPAELLISESCQQELPLSLHYTKLPDWQFDPKRCTAQLCNHFHTTTTAGLGLPDDSIQCSAAGVILQYLQSTQPQTTKLLTDIRPYSLSEFMQLDTSTRRNLELNSTLSGDPKGSLITTIDACSTPMGHRTLHLWLNQPLLSTTEIRARQDAVAAFHAAPMQRAKTIANLQQLGDLTRLINRLVAHQSRPRELLEIAADLRRLPNIYETLPANWPKPKPQLLLDQLPPIQQLIERAISPDAPPTLQTAGVIRPGYDAELDAVLAASAKARDWLSGLETAERLRTGLKNLKVGFNKVFGYYIEIPLSAAQRAPEAYIRKQTLVNAERFVTPELQEYESQVLNAEEDIRRIELRVYVELIYTIATHAATIRALADEIAQIDVAAGLAETAARLNYTKPEIKSAGPIEIRGGRHPVVETSLPPGTFVANDLIFDPAEVVRLVTGPNMSGKSTYLRQAAIIVLLAQIGSFVPAASASLPIVDRIFSRIGAQDELHAGQSTFMVEMVETANILHNATPRSLIILDELGRGTSTYDGLAIAWATVEYIHNNSQLQSATLFATHYHELTSLSNSVAGVSNYSVAVSDAAGQITFLHRIVPIPADRSYGIHVAQLAGLPPSVITRARQLLAQLESDRNTVGPPLPVQPALFQARDSLKDELARTDLDAISPIDALQLLHRWKNS